MAESFRSVWSRNTAAGILWRSTRESDFPLITIIEGKRYELYSDGTFAQVEK